jgi:NifU homolog involved in Fe-S cluster formation
MSTLTITNLHAPVGEGFVSTHSSSVNCIDDIDVFLKEEKGVVVDAVWTGVACAISTASTDILCDLLIGKKSDEALNIIAQYDRMLNSLNMPIKSNMTPFDPCNLMRP